jgi:hypothetical protein
MRRFTALFYSRQKFGAAARTCWSSWNLLATACPNLAIDLTDFRKASQDCQFFLWELEFSVFEIRCHRVITYVYETLYPQLFPFRPAGNAD